jgi:hypothetical protein
VLSVPAAPEKLLPVVRSVGLAAISSAEKARVKMKINREIMSLFILAIPDIIKNRYVIASKPNPSQFALANLDEVGIRKELTRIVNACKRNGCSCDIVMKDISTVCNRPENLFKWQEIAMEIVNNY